MTNFRNIFRDIIYVSRISKTQNKVLYLSLFLIQASAYTDIGIIVIFSAIIVNQYTGIELLNNLIGIFVDNTFLFPFLSFSDLFFNIVKK